MKILNDPERLSAYIRKYHIDSFFSSPQLPFALYVFEKGEFLNNLIDPRDYLCFPVSGTYMIMNIRDDGSMSGIYSGSRFTCFGDVEFARNVTSPFLIEILRRTVCVVLPLRDVRSQLENDPVFLRFLLSSAAQKLEQITLSMTEPKDLTERLLHYIDTQCDNGVLDGVGIAAAALQCSRRQLQRILKQLCDDGILDRSAKGRYIRSDSFPASC
ncbi:MAG: hypothetical protein IKG46_11075 [Solobacterium sp.]|nr:hypothetical protein [Solobacterium sp.]